MQILTLINSLFPFPFHLLIIFVFLLGNHYWYRNNLRSWEIKLFKTNCYAGNKSFFLLTFNYLP